MYYIENQSPNISPVMSHSYGTKYDILAGFRFAGNDENYGLIFLTAICLGFHGYFFFQIMYLVSD